MNEQICHSMRLSTSEHLKQRKLISVVNDVLKNNGKINM